MLSTYVDVRVSKQVDRAPTEDMLLVSEARASNAVIGQASSCACMISPLLVLCTFFPFLYFVTRSVHTGISKLTWTWLVLDRFFLKKKSQNGEDGVL